MRVLVSVEEVSPTGPYRRAKLIFRYSREVKVPIPTMTGVVFSERQESYLVTEFIRIEDAAHLERLQRDAVGVDLDDQM